jgi:hypothetical protein
MWFCSSASRQNSRMPSPAKRRGPTLVVRVLCYAFGDILAGFPFSLNVGATQSGNINLSAGVMDLCIGKIKAYRMKFLKCASHPVCFPVYH